MFARCRARRGPQCDGRAGLGDARPRDGRRHCVPIAARRRYAGAAVPISTTSKKKLRVLRCRVRARGVAVPERVRSYRRRRRRPRINGSNRASVQARMRELGIINEQRLQRYFFERIGELTQKYQRRIVGWDSVFAGGVPARLGDHDRARDSMARWARWPRATRSWCRPASG